MGPSPALQVTMGKSALNSTRTTEELTLIEDPVNARFNSCFLPVIEAIPAIVALFILILFAFQPVWSRRPQWLKLFIVEEPTKPEDEVAFATEKPKNFWTVLLLLFSSLGLVLQILAVFVPVRRVTVAPMCFAWVRWVQTEG